MAHGFCARHRELLCILSCGPLFGLGDPFIIALGIAISVASLSVEKFPARWFEISRRFCL